MEEEEEELCSLVRRAVASLALELFLDTLGEGRQEEGPLERRTDTLLEDESEKRENETECVFRRAGVGKKVLFVPAQKQARAAAR